MRTQAFFYGRKSSIDSNPLLKNGQKANSSFCAAKHSEIRQVAGTVPAGEYLKGIDDIVRKNGNTVTVLGREEWG